MIGFLFGLVLGLIPTVVLVRKNILQNKNKPPKYTRRGLYSGTYAVTKATLSQMGVKKYDVIVQFELGELESTDTMSKVEVISCVTNQSSCNNDKDRKEFSDLVNNSWMDSDQIQWITTVASKRNDKIDQILN